MAGNYKKFIYILEHWPINLKRVNRDYGKHLRSLVGQCLSTGNPYSGTEEENEKKLNALHRILENTHQKHYSCNYKIGANGLTLKELNKYLNDEFMILEKNPEKHEKN